MKNRPRIKLNLTFTDKLIEVSGWILLLGIWAFTLLSYSNLPETIAIHYNAVGEVNRFGEKSHLLILPIIGTILFVGMTILNKYPHIFNYPTIITEDNALDQYVNATQMIRILKLIIVFVFGLIIYSTISNGDCNSEGIGIWFLPLTITLFTLPTIYYLIRSMNIKSAK